MKKNWEVYDCSVAAKKEKKCYENKKLPKCKEQKLPTTHFNIFLLLSNRVNFLRLSFFFSLESWVYRYDWIHLRLFSYSHTVELSLNHPNLVETKNLNWPLMPEENQLRLLTENVTMKYDPSLLCNTKQAIKETNNESKTIPIWMICIVCFNMNRKVK